jgi:oligopeptide transport system permease protein
MSDSPTIVFAGDDFQPAVDQCRASESVRASRSFWKGVWQRLKKNPRAWFSLGVLFFMLSAVIAGPLLWTQSPSAQWLGETSSGATVSRSMPVWRYSSANTSIKADSFSIVSATTESVHLVWPLNDTAVNLRIYRHQREPRNTSDLGIPLVDLPPSQTSYQDSLNLRETTYWYSLVAIQQHSSSIIQTLAAQPQPVIDFTQAQLQSLIPLNADPLQWQGKLLTVPGHPLGTDALGRDLLARLIEGGRTSLFIGIVAPMIFVLIGAVFGATAALLGGQFDNWMMRFADFIVALPFLLFMILIRIAAGIQSGESGITAMLFALIILSWPTTARLVRAQVLHLKHEPFIESAILGGASTFYLVRHHLLPNVLAVVLVTLSFAIPQAIFIEAFLSFIGMGVTPPTASWGSLCQEGLKTMLVYPRELFYPAFCIALTVMAFNLLGDALRDALDIRMDSPV